MPNKSKQRVWVDFITCGKCNLIGGSGGKVCSQQSQIVVCTQSGLPQTKKLQLKYLFWFLDNKVYLSQTVKIKATELSGFQKSFPFSSQKLLLKFRPIEKSGISPLIAETTTRQVTFLCQDSVFTHVKVLKVFLGFFFFLSHKGRWSLCVED